MGRSGPQGKLLFQGTGSFAGLAVLLVLLGTSNMAERLHREIKRRSRVANLFPNEASVLRLVTAIHIEISEDWETGRAYLTL